jgi:hypothetical protein
MGRKISIVLVIILPLVLCIFAGIKLNDWLGKWTGAICATSIIINIYVFIGSYYFYKSERFYLWIQRQLLRFKRTDTNWYFQVSYENISQSGGKFAWQEEKFIDRLACNIEGLVGKSVSIEKDILYCLFLVIDNQIRLTLRYGDNGNASLAISKLLVPSHRYDEYISWLSDIFSEIEREFRSRDVQYRMHIEFPHKNPYFGFFVRNIPRKLLREFRCTFFSSLSEGASVDATNNEIIIDTDSLQKLCRLSKSYLSLSENLITR